MLKSMFIVGAGSFVGGVLRFCLSQCMKNLMETGFPWGTLAVNLMGCLIFGIIYGLFSRFSSPASSWCLLLTTGICGGFTTFSTFAYESQQMLQNGNLLGLISYISASILLGLALVGLGVWIVK
jgi:CrcB protein